MGLLLNFENKFEVLRQVFTYSEKYIKFSPEIADFRRYLYRSGIKLRLTLFYFKGLASYIMEAHNSSNDPLLGLKESLRCLL